MNAEKKLSGTRSCIQKSNTYFKLFNFKVLKVFGFEVFDSLPGIYQYILEKMHIRGAAKLTI